MLDPYCPKRTRLISTSRLNWQEKIAKWETTDFGPFEDPTQALESLYEVDEIEYEDYCISQFSEAQ